MKEYYVYILLCSDKSYYIGFTNDIGRRMQEHHCGADPDCYTYRKRPLELVYFDVFTDPKSAIAFEKQSRKKKQALISNNWIRLKELATCKNITTDSLFEGCK